MGKTPKTIESSCGLLSLCRSDLPYHLNPTPGGHFQVLCVHFPSMCDNPKLSFTTGQGVTKSLQSFEMPRSSPRWDPQCSQGWGAWQGQHPSIRTGFDPELLGLWGCLPSELSSETSQTIPGPSSAAPQPWPGGSKRGWCCSTPRWKIHATSLES